MGTDSKPENTSERTDLPMQEKPLTNHPFAPIDSPSTANNAEIQHQIGLLTEKIQKARETGDLENARDYCLEWLKIEPDSERAGEILSGIDTTLNQEHENLVIINRSKYLVQMKLYAEAIHLLETLPVNCGQAADARELMEYINADIKQHKIEEKIDHVLEEVSRLLENGNPEDALMQLENSGIQNSNERQILKRKIDRAIEVHQTETELKTRLLESLTHHDIEKARVWLGMIMELNPMSGIFEELRKNLDPERYQTLTSGMTMA
jgi:tetratricopeptide (TPR) repeat protein